MLALPLIYHSNSSTPVSDVTEVAPPPRRVCACISVSDSSRNKHLGQLLCAPYVTADSLNSQPAIIHASESLNK